MPVRILLTAAALALPGAAVAQSSNTSSNSSSNNGRTVETIDDSYCDDYGCDRVVERRVYRDDKRRWRDRDRRRSWRARRYRGDD